MFRLFGGKRGKLFKILLVAGSALLLGLVPLRLGSREEMPSVEEVRVQVERMFASESGSAWQLSGETPNSETFPEQ